MPVTGHIISSFGDKFAVAIIITKNVVKRSEFVYAREQRCTKATYYHLSLPLCSTGPNCRTKSGQIVGAGERVVEPDGRVCFCSMKNPEAVCSEPPRTTAPPSVGKAMSGLTVK